MRTAVFAHRHYVKLAAIIASLPFDAATREQITLTFSRELASTNPSFDALRFTEAAMGQPINGRDKR